MISSSGKTYRVVGHAIVSADGMIADGDGFMPAPLRNDADWAIFQAALDRTGVPEGVVAVTGGQRVFEHFLPDYDEFMLAEVDGFVLPGGTPCFSAGHPRAVLAAAGLFPAERQTIDPSNGVTLTRWERNSNQS